MDDAIDPKGIYPKKLLPNSEVSFSSTPDLGSSTSRLATLTPVLFNPAIDSLFRQSVETFEIINGAMPLFKAIPVKTYPRFYPSETRQIHPRSELRHKCLPVLPTHCERLNRTIVER